MEQQLEKKKIAPKKSNKKARANTTVSPKKAEKEALPEMKIVEKQEESFSQNLLSITDRLIHQLKYVGAFSDTEVRRCFDNASMKISLLSAELLLAATDLDESYKDFHAMTVAKYIHGIFEALLTARLTNSKFGPVPSHSLVDLAKAAGVEKHAGVFAYYDKAAALSRRPENEGAFSSSPNLPLIFMVVEELIGNPLPSLSIKDDLKRLKVTVTPSFMPKEKERILSL